MVSGFRVSWYHDTDVYKTPDTIKTTNGKGLCTVIQLDHQMDTRMI